MPMKLIPELAAIFGTDEVDDFGNPIPKKPSGLKPTKVVRDSRIPNPQSRETTVLGDLGRGALDLYGKAVEGSTDFFKAVDAMPAIPMGLPVPIPGRAVVAGANKALDVLAAPGAMTQAAAFDVADNMDERTKLGTAAGALQAALKAGKETVIDGAVPAGFSEQLARRGVESNGIAGALADMALDPTNVIPGKVFTGAAKFAAMPLMAGVTKFASKADDVARIAKAADAVADMGKVAESADPITRALNETLAATGRITPEALPAKAAKAVAEVPPPPLLGRAFPEDGVAYHGSQRSYDGVMDLKKADGEALYGPGLYWTDAPNIAGGYAGDSMSLSVMPDQLDKHIGQEFRLYDKAGYPMDGTHILERTEATGANSVSMWLRDTKTGNVTFQSLDTRMDPMSGKYWYRQSFPDLQTGTPGGNVRQGKLAIKNAFDIDAPVSEQEAGRLYDVMAKRIGLDPDGKADFVNTVMFPEEAGQKAGKNDWLYQSLDNLVENENGRISSARSSDQDYFDKLNATQGLEERKQFLYEMNYPLGHTRKVVNDVLTDAGYDGITHIGGGRTGNDAHRVWIALKPGLAKTKWGTELGSVSTRMASDLAGGALGAAVGAAADDEDRMRGAALGAAAGVAGAEGLMKLAKFAAKPSTSPVATQAAVQAAQTAIEDDKYVKGMITRVPERTEALGLPSFMRSTTTYNPGTTKRLADEAAIAKHIEHAIGLSDPNDKAMAIKAYTDSENFYTQRRMDVDPATGEVRSRSWSQSEDAASKLMWNRLKLAKGTALNAEQMLSLEHAVRGAVEYAGAVTEDFTKAQALMFGSPADQLLAKGILDGHGVGSLRALEAKADQAVEESIFVLQSAAGTRSEAGRTLNILKKKVAYQAIGKGDDDFIRKAAELGSNGAEIRQKMQTLTTPEQRYTWLRSMARPDAKQKFQYYYLTSLLSGPKTHARNLASNTIKALTMDAGYLAGRSWDVARGRMDPLDFKNEAAMLFHGQRVGLVQGWKEAVHAFNKGFTMQDAMTFANKPPELQLSDLIGTTKFDGAASQKWLNSVSRFLEASDQFARTVVYSGALHAGAYRKASQMRSAGKLRPSQVDKYVGEIIRDPELLAPEVHTQAMELAKDAVYRQDAGKLLQWAMQGPKKLDEWAAAGIGGAINKLVPTQAGKTVAHVVTAPLQNVGTLVAPFIKTPAGVYKSQARMMGAGFASANKALAAGNDLEAAIKRGEAMLGVSMMAGLGGYMFSHADGRPIVTGVGPNDPNLKDDPTKALDAFYGSHRPNSVRIGDEWVDYRSMGPLAGPLSVMGNLSDAYRQQGDKTNFAMFADAAARQARSMLSNSFMTGAMGLASAFEDRTGVSASRVAGRTVASLVPASGALRTARQVSDPVIRDTRGEGFAEVVGNNIKNIMPGLSKDVPARVDYTGNVLKNPGSPVERAISPFEMAPAVEDTTRNALAKLGPETYLTKPPKELKDALGNPMDLTNLQSTGLQRTVGVAQYQAAKQLLALPGFRELPADARAKMLRDFMQQQRDLAKQSFRLRLMQTSPAVSQ